MQKFFLEKKSLVLNCSELGAYSIAQKTFIMHYYLHRKLLRTTLSYLTYHIHFTMLLFIHRVLTMFISGLPCSYLANHASYDPYHASYITKQVLKKFICFQTICQKIYIWLTMVYICLNSLQIYSYLAYHEFHI